MEIKLTGSNEENFKKLETVLPRITRRMIQTREQVIPDSIITHYCNLIATDGIIFKCVLFSGRIKKVCFNLTGFSGKETPEYTISLTHGDEIKSKIIKSKKLSLTQEIDIDVVDGDLIEIRQTNSDIENPKLQDILISLLISLTLKDAEIKTIPIVEE